MAARSTQAPVAGGSSGHELAASTSLWTRTAPSTGLVRLVVGEAHDARQRPAPHDEHIVVDRDVHVVDLERRVRVPQGEHPAVLGQRARRVVGLGLDRAVAPAHGHREPRALGGAEAVRGSVAAPRNRHACAVATLLLPGRPSEDGVLAGRVGQVDVGQAELLAVVDVDRSGQHMRDQRHRARAGEARGTAAETCRWTERVVVRQRPRRRRAHEGQSRVRRLDHGAHPLDIPRGAHEVEVEDLVQRVRRDVACRTVRWQPCLAHRHAIAGVGVHQRAPAAIHVLHLVAVEDGGVDHLATSAHRLLAAVVEVGAHRQHEALGVFQVRVGHVLAQPERDVDPEPVDAEIEPEPQRLQPVGDDLGVGPVQVRLRRVERVQVPLPGSAVRLDDPLPRRAAEPADPVVRRQLAARSAAVAEVVPRAGGTAGCGCEGLLEPRAIDRRVVRDDVDDDPQPPPVRLLDEVDRVGQRAERRIDRARVRDVIAGVVSGGGVERRQPDRVDAQLLEVVQPRDDAREVAEAVAVRVLERTRIDLVDGCAVPPGARRRHAPTSSRPRRAA